MLAINLEPKKTQKKRGQFSLSAPANEISGGKRPKEETSCAPLVYSFRMAFMFGLLREDQKKQNPAPRISHLKRPHAEKL